MAGAGTEMEMDTLFNVAFVVLCIAAAAVKWYTWDLASEANDPVAKSFQRRQSTTNYRSV